MFLPFCGMLILLKTFNFLVLQNLSSEKPRTKGDKIASFDIALCLNVVLGFISVKQLVELLIHKADCATPFDILPFKRSQSYITVCQLKQII